LAKTVVIEELPADTQHILEQLLSTDEPVVLSRNGRPFGGMVAYAPDTNVVDSGDHGDRSLRDAVERGEADYAAGRYITLDQFRAKHAGRIGSEPE